MIESITIKKKKIEYIKLELQLNKTQGSKILNISFNLNNLISIIIIINLERKNMKKLKKLLMTNILKF